MEGEPRNPILRAFWSRPRVEAATSAIHAATDSMWLIWVVTGPAEELRALRAELPFARASPIEAVESEENARGDLLVAVRWGRPPASEGPAIEHLLAQMAAAGSMLRLRVHDGRIEVRAASHDGEGLLRFYQAMRSLLVTRYHVRLLRMGEARTPEASRDALRRDEEELLELALARGYYDEPKRCGVRELGDALGFSKSVVARKLRTLERRALENLKGPARAP